MDSDNSRRIAIKFFITACVISAVYYFIAEKFRQPIQVDGGSRVIMGTFARVVAVAKHNWQGKRCIEAGFKELNRIDAMMSDYKADSELSKVNREAFTKSIKVSPELFEILQISVEYSRLSKGAFDITVGPLVDLWRKAGEANLMPDENTLAATKARVGFEKMILDDNEQTVRFAVDGMRLDLGGIAKGYAVDKAVEAMHRCGALGGMVDSGGNIRCFGRPAVRRGLAFGGPANRDDWLIGLQDPNLADRSMSPPIMVLKLNPDKFGMSVATSGDYNRFVTVAGKKVSHIIDPNTATGARKLSSDTIITSAAVDADALSTIVNILGPDKGLELIESLSASPHSGGRDLAKGGPDAECILITAAPEYRIIKSSGVDPFLQ
jgi:thiamine biosynthesis lipoprotein